MKPNHGAASVRVEIPARLVSVYDDGSALVNADGIELAVNADEWEYIESDDVDENHE